ncbi:DUF883 domain-containing protein [Salinimonas lutimaris]|uniref:DUF883 domain-containing protein n=1 Tax=Salinimonas lutimaris TaxID=914153 RepID=UPI0010C07766|nr:DUF883 domain-containing protein [Salinimonas lutimaris]
MATQAKPGTTKPTGVPESTHPVTDKVQDTLHASVDKFAGSASKAEENFRSTASESAENFATRKRLAEQKWQGSTIRKYAVENPVAAAGIAFAAGMLVTSLLRRK